MKKSHIWFIYILIFLQSIVANASETFYIDTLTVDENSQFKKEIPSNAEYLFLDMNISLSNNGDGHGMSKSEWGITWSHKNDDYYKIMFRCGNTDYGDLLDTRFMNIEVTHIKSGKTDIIKRFRITEDFDMYNGCNRVTLEIYKNEIRLFGGNKDIVHIGSLKIGSSPGGVFTIFSKNTNLKVQPIAGEYGINKVEKLSSKYQNETVLDSSIIKSKNPLVGYWKYLDRNNNPDMARLGGYYRLAIVEENGEFLILYISNAEVNKTFWQSGMIKGRLTPTIFKDHYDVVWYDAEMLEINKEVHASVINNVILSIEFPLYKTTLRFSKEL